jgi:activator of 2-hydroxyglutaryl-CoA dehydratase
MGKHTPLSAGAFPGKQGDIMKTYRAGIDIGSTTVKLVLLDEQDNLIFGEYQRHHANTQKTLAQLLRRAQQQLGQLMLKVKITGSGSIKKSAVTDVPDIVGSLFSVGTIAISALVGFAGGIILTASINKKKQKAAAAAEA